MVDFDVESAEKWFSISSENARFFGIPRHRCQIFVDFTLQHRTVRPISFINVGLNITHPEWYFFAVYLLYDDAELIFFVWLKNLSILIALLPLTFSFRIAFFLPSILGPSSPYCFSEFFFQKSWSLEYTSKLKHTIFTLFAVMACACLIFIAFLPTGLLHSSSPDVPHPYSPWKCFTILFLGLSNNPFHTLMFCWAMLAVTAKWSCHLRSFGTHIVSSSMLLELHCLTQCVNPKDRSFSIFVPYSTRLDGIIRIHILKLNHRKFLGFFICSNIFNQRFQTKTNLETFHVAMLF